MPAGHSWVSSSVPDSSISGAKTITARERIVRHHRVGKSFFLLVQKMQTEWVKVFFIGAEDADTVSASSAPIKKNFYPLCDDEQSNRVLKNAGRCFVDFSQKYLVSLITFLPSLLLLVVSAIRSEGDRPTINRKCSR